MKTCISILALLATYPTVSFGADIDVLRDRRIAGIVYATTGATSIASWYANSKTLIDTPDSLNKCDRISTLDANGKWPDSEIDYTTGFDARRANWPAQTHWLRISM